MGARFVKRRRVLDQRTAWEYYNAGETDKVIAEHCGCVPETIRNWRKINGLSSNYDPKDQKHHKSRKSKKQQCTLSPIVRDAMAAREAGMTYGQYKAEQSKSKQKGRKK